MIRPTPETPTRSLFVTLFFPIQPPAAPKIHLPRSVNSRAAKEQNTNPNFFFVESRFWDDFSRISSPTALTEQANAVVHTAL